MDFNLSFKLVYHSRKLLGLVLLLAGMLFKHARWNFLGWYMLGAGINRRFPRKFESLQDAIVRQYEKRKHESCFNYLGDGWVWCCLWAADDIMPCTDEDGEFDDSIWAIGSTLAWDIHKTMGKFMVRVRDNVLEIMDEYIFYPTCMDDELHGRNCKCPEKTWGAATDRYNLDIPQGSRLHQLYTWLRNKLPHTCYGDCYVALKCVADDTCHALKVKIVLHPDNIYIEVGVSDYICSLLGKPFWTVGKVLVEQPA